MAPAANRVLFWILAVLALVIVVDNLDRPLANPDEGRYAEIGREMVQSGDWVTPRLNGIKYFEKPPLQYWATAASLAVFPHVEYAARLYIALCSLATLLLVMYTARRTGTPDTGLAAGIALVSSPYFMLLGGIVTLDAGLTLWTTLTFCAYVLSERAQPSSIHARRWMLVAWAAMALAVLQKGLVGVVFPAGALACWCVLRRDPTPLARLHWRLGLPLFLAIAAPWFIAVSLANPEFARFFFIHEHFERFLTTSHRRVEPWWYFLPIVALGFLPWMFALPSALRHAWKIQDARAAAELRLAMLGAFIVVAFFSASGSKLPAYILPAFPPLALVLGRYLAEAPARKLALQVMPLMLVGAALLMPALHVASRQSDPWARNLYANAQPYAIAATVAIFAVGALSSWAFWRGRRWVGLGIAAIGMVILLDCVEDGYEEMSPRQSGKEVAAKMAAAAGPDTRIYSVRYFEHTVPFYLGRTVTLVEYTDEFEQGLKSEPALRIPDLDSFRADWLRPGGALAIMNPATFVRLQERAVPMQVLHDDPRRILVRKP